ncbi:ABC transporter substrate-binding protein [Halorubrum halophilum]|uniref:substrate-binding domain-containing protein n=1 Tax=Halorubrum halophilum TaxID=413816 RepID=UPI00186B3A5C|nr:ABC transporter substrate-binding protein [Halorubrum halophilum]
MGDNPADRVSRRSFVKYSGAAGVTGALAGCSSNGGGGGGGDGSDGSDGSDGGDGSGSSDGSDGSDAPDEVIIGSNHPLSGSLSNTGERMDQAVKLAAMIKNEAGGIESLDGAELSVVSGDNEGAQELGGEVAQELIDEGASVLTGCYSSPVTSAATRTAESAGVPFVISVSVANSILQETQLNYAYRPQPPANQMAVDHARLLADAIRNAGEEIETAGLFYIDISFGQSVRDALREELPANDIEIVAETAIGFGETADTQVTTLRDADPDAVIATTYRQETIELVNAMNNQNYQPKYVTGCSNAAMNDVSALEEMGDTVEGGFATNFALDPTSDAAGEVRSRFESEFETSFDANVAMTYAATQVIIAAIEEAGSADPDDINDALGEITVEDHIAAMPPITFADNGENENSLAPLFQVQDLRDRVIAPEEFAEADVQF